MTTSNLVVPVVMWGRYAPTHCISSILMTPDQRHIVTGCNDGQICVWVIDDNWKAKPRNMYLGHTAAVTCLAMGSSNPEKQYVVSSSDNGEMCVWDLSDGRCIENTKLSYTHTSVQAYQMMHCRDVRLVCNGYYPEIHIIHPISLEVMFSLSSKIQPDWISALCILRPVKREDDVVVAITNAGTVKVWTLSGSEGKHNQPIYEDEAKQIRCLNAQTLKCCAYNQRTVLIVCSKYWQIYDTNYIQISRDRSKEEKEGIYDAGDFSLLCSESNRRGERWAGGEFISVDKVVVWSNEGKGYLYKLPTNANPTSESYRKTSPQSPHQGAPQAYTILDVYMEKPLECAPAMSYILGRRERESKLVLRGDAEGRIVVWSIPSVTEDKMKLARQESFDRLPVVQPKCVTTLQDSWNEIQPPPEGIIDQLNVVNGKYLQITASIFIPLQGRLVCGRDDGSIIIVPAVQAITLLLLKSDLPKDSLPHRTLEGHIGRVNCLLYPHNDSPRYDQNHLVSGGVDFTVILWDISSGTKLHTFCVHGGEISQMLVPPVTCNQRILPCICSVASDHSLALLSLRERKCILLAGRQLFPIMTVKWRPMDDFLVVGCTDGTVYVWQMETGHLDRVVHGITAEEILNACDEKLHVTADQLVNPTISLAQAFKRRNLATFRNLAQQQLNKPQEGGGKEHHPGINLQLVQKPQAHPMNIQGLRTNTKDPDSHILFFDTEALIVQLLSEEYAAMSPTTLEAMGFLVSTDKDKYAHMSEPQKKIHDFFSKVKDKAEEAQKKIQAEIESAGFKPISPRTQRKAGEMQKGGDHGNRPKSIHFPETSLIHEISQLYMSFLHGWGLDADLDRLCLSKLNLLRPKLPLSFGLLSRGGHLSLLLPGWHVDHISNEVTPINATNGHWLISNAITTQHLLSVISTANTLMSLTHSFASRKSIEGTEDGETDADQDQTNQAQIKQSWSLLAALHCVLLPDLIGKDNYKSPMLEMLARRWQDRCLEIREAAQALFLAELRRIGAEGRKQLVDDWSPYLPSYVDPALSLLTEYQQGVQEQREEDDEEDEDQILGDGSPIHRASQSFESRRKQATAIVMMGVLGAEFGHEIEPSKRKTMDEQKKKNVVEGFGLTKYSHAMHTSKALTFLLLQPPSSKLPAFSPIRRAAIDLLGRGFTVWEPYLDVSAVLLGLLELCVDGDKLVPSMTFGLPLTPQADACRTSRHALSLIATARPPAFIITMAKEVARYNAMAQNAQTPHQQLHNSVLIRGKSEILRIIELLVDKIPNEVVELLVEVMDVTVHCLDQNAIKNKGLQEVFPAICRFSMVSYCNNTRRISVGAKNGGVAFYELKQSKCQILPAHGGAVTAVAFSPDGKYLASFSHIDNKLCFWQTASSSIFGIGSQHTKCIKTYATPPVNVNASTNPLKIVRLIWVDTRTVVLLCVDGTESRFKV